MAIAIFQLFFRASAMDAAAAFLALSVLTDRPYGICGGGAKGVCAIAGKTFRANATTETNELPTNLLDMAASSLLRLEIGVTGLRACSA
jgi:hypothetical protein